VVQVLDRCEQEDIKEIKIKTVDELVEKISRYYQMEVGDFLRNETKKYRDARYLFVYLKCSYLGESVTKLGKMLRVRQAAASKYKWKGYELFKGVEYQNGIIE